jgi:hypothetical protein
MAKDKNMQRNFTKPIYQWLLTDPLHTATPADKLPFITGFEFNEKSLLQERLRLPPYCKPNGRRQAAAAGTCIYTHRVDCCPGTHCGRSLQDNSIGI